MDERIALTGERLVESGLVTKRQLDWWAAKGLVAPTVSRRAGRYRVRLYTLADAMEVAIVAHLRSRRVSLQHIRKLTSYLRGEGYDRPLREVRWAVESGLLYFQRADGTWYESRRPVQGVIPEIINLDEIRARLAASVDRPADSKGRTERRSGVLGRQEVVAGTRIPTATVERWVTRGHSDERILQAYPDLDRRDVEAARARLGAAAHTA